MPNIINLSAIHSLKPIHHGISAFASLCNKYSKSTLSCCPGFFSQGTNYAWVMYQYYQSLNTLINPYKLGKMTTEEFISRLFIMFPFMANPELEISPEDIKRLNDNKSSLYTLREVENPSTLDYAKALLEEAWNSIITFTDEDISKVEKVFEEGVDIYFMSNTNELNVFKILSWLKTNFPEKVDLSLTSPTIRQQKDLPFLQIGLGKHLVASYLGHTFKTAEDNTNAGVPSTTPTLLQAIIGNVFNNEVDNLTIISQYPKDLEVARKLGIKDTNLAGDYFKKKQQSETSLFRS